MIKKPNQKNYNVNKFINIGIIITIAILIIFSSISVNAEGFDSNNEEFIFTNHTDSVSDVTIDSNGYVYSVSYDNTLRKITPNGTEEWIFNGHDNAVMSVDTDSNYIYTASKDNTVKKIDKDGNVIWTKSDYSEDVHSVNVDENGNVYTGTANDSVRKLDSNGNELWEFNGHTHYVYTVIAKNGYVYTSSEDGTIKKLDSNGNHIWTFSGFSDAIEGIAVNNTGYVIAGSDSGGFKKINPEGNQIWSHSDFHDTPIYDIVVDEDNYIYTASNDGGSAFVKKFDSKGNLNITNNLNDDNAFGLGISPETNNEQYIGVATSYTENNVYKFTKSLEISTFDFEINKNSTQSGENVTYTAIFNDGDVTTEIDRMSHNTTIFDTDLDGNIYSNAGYTGVYEFNARYTTSDGTEYWDNDTLELTESNLTFNIDKENIIDKERSYWNAYLNSEEISNNINLSYNQSAFNSDIEYKYITAKEDVNGSYNITLIYENKNGKEIVDTDSISVTEAELNIEFEDNSNIFKENETKQYNVWMNGSTNKEIGNQTELFIRNIDYDSYITIDENNTQITAEKAGKFEIFGVYDDYGSGLSNTTREGTKEIIVSNNNLTLETDKNTLNIDEKTNYYAYYNGTNVTQNITLISKNTSILSVDSQNYKLIGENSGITKINATYKIDDKTYYTNKTIEVINQSKQFDLVVENNYLFGEEKTRYYAIYNETYVNQDITFIMNKTNLIEINKTNAEFIALENNTGYVNVTATYVNDSITYSDSVKIYINNNEFDLQLEKTYLNGSEKISYKTYYNQNSISADNIEANNSLIDIQTEIVANEDNSGYVEIYANYTDSSGITYEDTEIIYINNNYLNVSIGSKYIQNSDSTNILVEYGTNDVTSISNYTLNRNLVEIDQKNKTIIAKNEGSGIETINVYYTNKFGKTYKDNIEIEIGNKTLTIRTTDFMEYNETAKYTIKYGDKIVTNNVTITTNTSELLIINEKENLLESTSNTSIKGYAYININYTDKYGYYKETQYKLFIGNESAENIDYLPPLNKGIVLLENTQIQALLFIITAGMGVTLFINAYAGILGSVLGVGIGLVIGVFSLGYFVMSLITGVFIILNSDIRFKE